MDASHFYHHSSVISNQQSVISNLLTMASAHSILMQVVGVSDVVDAIVDIDIRSNRYDVHTEMSGQFDEADVSLMQLASEYYDEFHGASGVIANWKDAPVNLEEMFAMACEVTWSLAELVHSVQNKEEFLAVVKERHAGVAFSRMVAIGYMTYVLEDARA